MADEQQQSTPQRELREGGVTEQGGRPERPGGADEGDQARAKGDGGGASSASGGDISEEQLDQEMEKLEQDPPENLEDWPDGPLKYKTFGGPEGDHSYDEGPESQLGPSSLRRHDDGSVEVEGEQVENPDDYKRERLENPMSQTADGDDGR